MKVEYINDIALPFILTTQQILYVSDRIIPLYEDFFERFEKEKPANNSGLKSVVTIKSVITNFESNTLSEIIEYQVPAILETNTLVSLIDQMDTIDFSKVLFKYLEYCSPINPGFILTINQYTQAYITFQAETEKEIINIINDIDSVLALNPNRYRGSVMFKLCKSKQIKDADILFERYSKELDDEIIEKIQKINKPEICHFLIKVLQQKLKENGNINKLLSPLLIDNEYRFLLPQFKNKEVKLTPICKALYLLFLKHEEGIILKELPKYKYEFIKIYKNLAYRESWENILVSASEITDPLSNSIHEKCSRIKNAFLEIMDDEIASYYYITGQRNLPKKILLERSYVQLNIK